VRRPTKKIPVGGIVDIVGNGAMAGTVADGVMIPVLILDTRDRPDIAELIRIHTVLAPGDVRFQWGLHAQDKDLVLLELAFDRPMEVQLHLCFGIEDEGILVDAAVRAQAVYLQAGKPGDRLRHNVDAPKLLAELPSTGFERDWEKAFLGRMTAVLAKSMGLPRRRARPQARELIDEMREKALFRFPQS